MGVIIKPIFTEKQTAVTEKFENRYGFIVVPGANKVEIKNAIESLYNVHVEQVNTMIQCSRRTGEYNEIRWQAEKPLHKIRCCYR